MVMIIPEDVIKGNLSSAGVFQLDKESDPLTNSTTFSIEGPVPLGIASDDFPNDRYEANYFLGCNFISQNSSIWLGANIPGPTDNYQASWNLQNDTDFASRLQEIPAFALNDIGNMTCWLKLSLSIFHRPPFATFVGTLVNQVPLCLSIFGYILATTVFTPICIDAIRSRSRKSKRVTMIEGILVPISVAIIVFVPIYLLALHPFETPLIMVKIENNIINLLYLYIGILIGGIVFRVAFSMPETPQNKAVSSQSTNNTVSTKPSRSLSQKFTEAESTGIRERVGKLDSFFLWITSLVSLGFSLFIAYLKMPLAPYIPIFVLIGISISIGYIDGAIFSDSFTDRIRGWNYLLLGLSFYVPAAAVRFGEPYFKTFYTDYPKVSPYFEILLGLIIPIVYVLLNRRVAVPKVYRSFNIDTGEITNRILARTYSASICFGCLLYVLALALYETKMDNLSIALYVLFFILFIDLVISEEVKIRTLRKIEKFQQFVKIESIVDKKLYKISLALLAIGVVAFVILWSFSAFVTFYLLLLFFWLAFIFPILGLIILTLFVYRGERVQLNDESRIRLSETQLAELRSLINKINDHVSCEPKK
jgi:hypothetical protein